MPSQIFEEELTLLRRVLDALDQGPDRAKPSDDSIVRELEHLREVMVEGGEAKDQGALVQQFERQSALLRQLRASRDMPQVHRDSPYFAHIRLRENADEWDLCLGKATFIRGDVCIVDWRNAPISHIYYRYRQGESFEEEVSGRLREGDVVARRAVAIRAARLERIESPEGIFCRDPGASAGWRQVRGEPARLAGGQGAAMRAHERGTSVTRRLGTDEHGAPHRADKHLPDIAGLIDPEQFSLIVRPSSGLVVIRGSAGSGKTTVALHRIAYLAYEDEAVDSERTLVIVFSRALRSYVSHVLPALGVRRVQVRTLHDWAAEQRQRLFPALPRVARDDTPASVYRLKVHPAMLHALDEQVKRTDGLRTAAQAIDDWTSALGSEALLEEVFSRAAPGLFSTEEIRRVTRWSRDRAEEVASWMRGDKESGAELDSEDDALLLRAWQLRVGPLPGRGDRPLRYRHIAVDEVQDFSPLEVRVLLDCLDQRKSMTLAGDTQQHVMVDSGFTSWDEFFDYLAIPGTAVDTLRVSYRSTREIAEFASSVLGDLREDDSAPITTRSGPPVELFRFTDHGACVAFLTDALDDLLRKEPLASVALLTPSRALSQVYHRGLASAEVAPLRWVRDQDFSFAPGVEVTEIEQAKGLEFDYVVLVEVSTTSFSEAPSARRLLHVGATRAVHQLWLTSVATPSSLVRDALRGR